MVLNCCENAFSFEEMLCFRYVFMGTFTNPLAEDPLTGTIALEQGSAPYSNWNERIHAECYRPTLNGAILSA